MGLARQPTFGVVEDHRVVARVRERATVLDQSNRLGSLGRQGGQSDSRDVRRRRGVVPAGVGGLDAVADAERGYQRHQRDQRTADSSTGHEQALYDVLPESRASYRRMSESMTAATVGIQGDHRDEIEAYLARPEGAAPRGGVVVIHHMPGYDRGTKEMVRRFAVMGYDAICPNLYSRQAPGAAPDDAAAVARANGGIPDDQLVGDVAGAAAYLRTLPTSNGKVGVIGHCSGGRQSVLAACNVDLDAAVDCYGAYVTGTPPADWPLKVTNLVDQLPELRCPLLGLFGKEDKYPSPEQVDELQSILSSNGKSFERHDYDDAAHAFFAVDRPSYRPLAAVDGWQRIETFYGNHLGG